MVHLANDWDNILRDEWSKPYYLKLREFLKTEFKTRTIYPNMHDIFNSLKLAPFDNVKVVILGQDPYINPGEAHGLAFSVQRGAKIPPSLKNIFKELVDDVSIVAPSHGCLEDWAQQGVLLLNTVLTVRAGQSKSHAGKGWEEFTSHIIKKLDDRETPIVFMLWGRDACAKQELVKNPQHLVLTAAHPSPLAGGRFFGCKHFSKANEFLAKQGLTQVNWQI